MVRKSTLIMAALVILCAGTLRAEGNPVQYLPGMAASGGLPREIITDLTNYPNPFDSRKPGMEGQTLISYMLAKDAKVSVEVYGLLGHRVRSWEFTAGANGGRQGSNLITWDGTNDAGRKVSKGGYLAQIVIETPETTVTAVRKIGVIH